MDLISWKLVRLVAVLALALWVPVLVWHAVNAGAGGERRFPVAVLWSLAASAAGFVVLVLAPLAPRLGRAIRLTAGAGGAAGLLAHWSWGWELDLWPRTGGAVLAAVFIGQALAAVLAGAVTLSTALGHAYLTATDMTIAPLRRLSTLFAAAVAVRAMWVVLVGGGLMTLALRRGTLETSALHGQLLMLAVRGVVGLLLPAVFAYMVRETVRLRATQSATGILYFTLVLVYIGELASQYLVHRLGLPL